MRSNPQTCSDAMSVKAMVFERRVETASHEYRMKLHDKAVRMRAAVSGGETADPRVLAVAEALERLAGNDS